MMLFVRSSNHGRQFFRFHHILTRNGHDPTVGHCFTEVTASKISWLVSGDGRLTATADADVFAASGLCVSWRHGDST